MSYDYAHDPEGRYCSCHNSGEGLFWLIIITILGSTFGPMIDKAGGVLNFTLVIIGILVGTFAFIFVMGLLGRVEKHFRKHGTKKQKIIVYVVDTLAITVPLLGAVLLIAFGR